MANTFDVIVVGAGVMSCGTAYWLSKVGYKVLVLEQDALACGASGVAAAMLESVGHGARLLQDDPLAALARTSFPLHQELQALLREETGIDIGYRENPALHPIFSEAEVATLKPQVVDLSRHNPAVQWLEGPALWEVEPRLHRAALGVLLLPQAQLLAYRFVLALVQVAERRGMALRHGEVVGLERHAGHVTGVRLRHGQTIAIATVVLAMGPWNQHAAAWLGLHIPVYPVRGQLLEFRVPDPQP
jgi:glycine oxidase